MTVKQVMNHGILSINADDSVTAAAKKMRIQDVSILPVLKDGAVIGAVSQHDIITKVIAQGLDPQLTKVHTIISKEGPFLCRSDDSVEYCKELMDKSGRRRLLVIDLFSRPVGMVRIEDVAVHLLSKQHADARQSSNEPN